MQVGNSRVKKILMGDKVVYQDSDGWIPLELPPTAIDGVVLFKDNGDGTASIAGTALYKLPLETETLLTPPTGYSFSSVNWNFGPGSISGICMFGGFGNNAGGTPYSAPVTVDSGNLIIHSKVVAYMNSLTIGFTQAATTNGPSSAMPAIVGIEKV